MPPLTTQDAAARLGITPGLVAKYIRQGRLRATRFGRDWKIEAEDLEQFAATERPKGWPKGRPRKA